MSIDPIPKSSGTRPPEPLARQLSALGVWLLVINGIIGAGIFGLPAEAARLAGGFSPWVFVICAALMLPVMLCFAELASRFDGTGGPVRYAGEAFGPYAGFMAGWAFYVARLTAFSANAVLLVGTIGHFWPAADQPGVRLMLLALLCAGLTAITYAGTRNAIGSLGLLTILKLLPLAGLVAYGCVSMPAELIEAEIAVSFRRSPDTKKRNIGFPEGIFSGCGGSEIARLHTSSHCFIQPGFEEGRFTGLNF